MNNAAAKPPLGAELQSASPRVNSVAEAWPRRSPLIPAQYAPSEGRAAAGAIEVAAAVIRRRGRYLMTRRALAHHLGGLWEFPGGKRRARESLEVCLRRELREELGVEALVGERIAIVPWSYPDREVVLHFFLCGIGNQAVRAREGQPLRWVTSRELRTLPVPPADAALVTRLTARPRTPGRRPGRARPAARKENR
jgi:mutator protein MutT